MTIEQLFFELIQVAIGTRICLSHTPCADEWGELYAMAKKQSLVGVCFAGVQKLQTQQQCPPEMLYLTWMGMAAKIQQRNEVVNRQCVELGERLEVKGYRYAILKGQGVASLYKVSGSNWFQKVCASHPSDSLSSRDWPSTSSSDLSLLRQSGDIDVWVQNKSIPELVEYLKGLDVGYKATAAHVECELFDGTDVELHAEPAFMRDFRTNRKLVQWFNRSEGSIVESELGFNFPSIEFNLVYMMVHMYHHVLFEGLGLRQLMDYYFVLRTVSSFDSAQESSSTVSSFKLVAEPVEVQEVSSTIESLGMKKFASGILWIIEYVFNGNLEPYGTLKPFETASLMPSEKYGRLILEDVMAGGNFGHHDEKNKGLHGGAAVGRSLSRLKRNMKFFTLGPWEILSSPLWSTWHWWWRKRHGLL